MSRNQFGAILVAIAGASGAFGGVDSRDRPIAFVNVDVVTMESEGIERDQTVVVHQEKIRAIGAASSTVVPDDALRIDGHGRFLVPGLADMHAHLWNEDQLALYLANGVTTVRNMLGAPIHLVWREQIDSGELSGPTIYTAGPVIDGDPPASPGHTVRLSSPEHAAAAVEAQVAAGYDFLKVYSRLRPEVYEAVVAAAVEHGIAVAGHVPATVGYERASTAGQVTNEHLTTLQLALASSDSPFRNGIRSLSDMFRSWGHVDLQKLPTLVAATRRSGMWNCPTLVVPAQSFDPDVDRLLARPEMRFVSPSMRRQWLPENGGRAQVAADALRTYHDSLAVRLKIVRALHLAGSRLLLGTDSPNPWLVPGFSAHDELQLLLKAGLSPWDALKTGTVNAAEALGRREEFGTIGLGRRADLILLEADPLDDLSNLARRVGVMARGRWYREGELQARLEALAERHAEEQRSTVKSVVFEHVNVVPMDRQGVLPDQTVIVREGRIIFLGPTPVADRPKEVSKTIDGSDLYLMPGLADMHAHIHPAFFTEQDLVLLVANGVTTVRNMRGTPQHLDWRERVAQGELLGPNIYTSGPILEGDPPVQRGTTVVTTAEEARRAVREQKEAGYDFVKIYHSLSKDTFEAIVAAGREFGIGVAGHVPNNVGIDFAMEAGLQSIEHLWGYSFALQASTSPFRSHTDFEHWTDWFRTWDHLDASGIPALAHATAQDGTWNCPTLVAPMSKHLRQETAERLARPEVRYVSPKVRGLWAGRETPEEVVHIGRRSHALRLRIVKELHDHGAGLLLGTDFPGSFIVPGFSIHEELQYLVDAGLTPFEALRSGTTMAADYFDAGEEFGAVAVGRRADLLLLDGNPLADVGNVADLRGVILRGRWYSRADLQAKLEGLAESYADAENRSPPE